jgi:predicted Zn finger-like uncharacterized protein
MDYVLRKTKYVRSREAGKIRMRLTCPNCDAQYEVPDEVMPTSGRDVQCSNCGQTWFQHRHDHAPDEENDAIDLSDPGPDPDEEASPPPPPKPATAAPERRKLDPAVADILRQEAEAEYAARKSVNPNALETQTDLGLEETQVTQGETYSDNERRTVEAKRRMARMRGEPEPVAAAAIATGPRRELLPNIEEINSTLRSDADLNRNDTVVQGTDDVQLLKKPKGSFSRGFVLMLVLTIIFAALYIFAPQIARAVPQVDPYLSAYVGWVDSMRVWFDGQVKTILTWLDSMASQAAN